MRIRYRGVEERGLENGAGFCYESKVGFATLFWGGCYFGRCVVVHRPLIGLEVALVAKVGRNGVCACGEIRLSWY